jgi:fucose 4-O-acetylase-like acetyltransferase
MNRILSRRFRFLTFASIFLLAYVHGYNLNETYLTPYSTVNERLTLTTWFEYLVSNGLLRFRIPILFGISGYLYAMFDNAPYWQRTRRRFVSLILPYVLWSALGLLLTFLLQQMPFTFKVLQAAHIDQLGDNRLYTEVPLTSMVKRLFLAPVSYQLWFLRVLFMYNLLYPVFRWLVAKVPVIWFACTFLLWAVYFNMYFIESQGLFFFSLGVWLFTSNRNIEKPPTWYSQGLAWIFFIGVCVIKTFMAFELEPNTPATFVLLSVLHKLAVLSGVLAVWFSVDPLAAWWMRHPVRKQISGSSFFIFGMHIPLLVYVMYAARLSGWFIFQSRLVNYLVIPLLVMGVCMATAWATQRYLPRLYKLLTGGRGL